MGDRKVTLEIGKARVEALLQLVGPVDSSHGPHPLQGCAISCLRGLRGRLGHLWGTSVVQPVDLPVR